MSGGFFKGENYCALADGSVQQPSIVCSLFVACAVIQLASWIMTAYRAPHMVNMMHVANSAVVIYIMYNHCQRCNGVTGFGKTLLLSLISATIAGMMWAQSS